MKINLIAIAMVAALSTMTAFAEEAKEAMAPAVVAVEVPAEIVVEAPAVVVEAPVVGPAVEDKK